VYQPNDAAATGIGNNRKATYLSYTPRAEEVPSLTQRYDSELLSQHVVEHCHEARSLYSPWSVNGLFSSNASINCCW